MEHLNVAEPRKQHGLTALVRRVNANGMNAIDGRTVTARALVQWRSELIQDLGGNEAISTQEATLVEMAARTKLLLDSIDGWLLGQRSLVNARKKAVLPVVRERGQLADTLSRLMQQLGLERRAKVPSLAAFIADRAKEKEPA
jgi:hypothetical protein